jgi:hypothetical protein
MFSNIYFSNELATSISILDFGVQKRRFFEMKGLFKFLKFIFLEKN